MGVDGAEKVWYNFGRRKRLGKMDKMVIFVSDCCGCESHPDYEVCSRCGEHCEIITEEYSA